MTPNYEISGACGLTRFAEANRGKWQCVRCIGLLGDKSLYPFRRHGRREVVVNLQVHPELRAGPKCFCQEPRRIRRDSALAANQFIDSLNWNAEVLRKVRLR